jgi:NADPH-dependent glutamate synthase beta subunit-like oxidoreductase
VTGVEFIKNELGNRDISGRRRPVPVSGTEFTVELDTLIVAIGEQPDTSNLSGNGVPGVEATEWGMLKVDAHTLATGRPGVFAGGDVVTGPNTVVDAIAAGKTVAVMIDRYLRGEVLRQPARPSRPTVFVEPAARDQLAGSDSRPKVPHVAVSDRFLSFDEVEKAFNAEAARAEAANCLRCDLEFTKPGSKKALLKHSSGGQA